MSLRKELIDNSSIVSYSFRSTSAAQEGNFIYNFPIHIWLSNLGIPKALANIILFEYWLSKTEKNIVVHQAFSYETIYSPFSTTYPLRKENGELFFPCAPVGSHERSMSTLALEARLYKSRSYDSTSHTIQPGTYALLEQHLPPLLAQIRFPKVLNNIVLGYLNYETWQHLWYGNHYCFNESLKYKFPWEEKKKYHDLTRALIQEDEYPLQEQPIIIMKGLLLTYLNRFPEALIPIITDYIGNDMKNESNKSIRDVLLDELTLFIQKYAQMETIATHTIKNYVILQLALESIKAIRQGKGFEPVNNDEKEYKYLSITDFRTGHHHPVFPGYPVEHAFHFLHTFFTDFAFSTSAYRSFNMTFFEHVIKHIGWLQPEEIQNVSRIFYLAKSLIESAYILSTKAPSNTLYYFDSDVVRSLCLQVNRLQLGEEIKGLNNRGRRPVLLNKLSNVLDEPLSTIEFNGQKGFLGSFPNKEKGIRFFNYHKRSNILDILYKYVNDQKAFSKRMTLFSSKVNYSNQAKNLANRLLNISFASPKEFVILDEINQLLNSQTIKSDSYRQVLCQVKSELLRGLNHEKQDVSLRLR